MVNFKNLYPYFPNKIYLEVIRNLLRRSQANKHCSYKKL